MSAHRLLPVLAVVLGVMALQVPVGAQFVDSLKRTARAAAEHEARRKVAELVRNGVRCVFDDFDCIRSAEESGKTAVMTDEAGTLLLDDEGVPITDPDEARGSLARSREAAGRDPGRANLARFHGVYGNPDGQNDRTAPRNFFVAESCDGSLEFGAMWGDVAPWTLRSESATVFVQARAPKHEAVALRLEFAIGADRRASSVTHNLEWRTDNPLIRLSDLPAAFAERECPQPRE